MRKRKRLLLAVLSFILVAVIGVGSVVLLTPKASAQEYEVNDPAANGSTLENTAHSHPLPSTPEARSSHDPRDLASHLHTRSGQTRSGEEEYPSSGT